MNNLIMLQGVTRLWEEIKKIEKLTSFEEAEKLRSWEAKKLRSWEAEKLRIQKILDIHK